MAGASYYYLARLCTPKLLNLLCLKQCYLPPQKKSVLFIYLNVAVYVNDWLIYVYSFIR